MKGIILFLKIEKVNILNKFFCSAVKKLKIQELSESGFSAKKITYPIKPIIRCRSLAIKNKNDRKRLLPSELQLRVLSKK